MVTQVYAHILDEDRKVNAQKFEMAFYANADLRGVEQRLRAESAVAEPDSEILLKQLEAKPELMDAFTKKFVEQYGEQIMNQLAKKTDWCINTQESMRRHKTLRQCSLAK